MVDIDPRAGEAGRVADELVRVVAAGLSAPFVLDECVQSVVELLAQRGVNELHVEAGATLAGAFLAAGVAWHVGGEAVGLVVATLTPCRVVCV